MRYPSPLRYPGGKAKIAPVLAELFWQAPADMCEVWLEPFAGGAGAAISAMTEFDVPEAWLVEANPALRAFWNVILSPDGNALCERVGQTKPSLELFYHCRELVVRSYGDADVDEFELAYAAFVVNRCSFSGIVAGSSGPIGGARHNGTNTVASRFNPSSLEQRLRVVHELRTRLRILDAEDGVACIEELDTAGLASDVFVFCDPPYVEDAPRLYERSFDTEDHRRLAQALRGLAGSWALTYDDHPLVRELYDGMRVAALPMPHRAGRAHEDVELLITPR